MRLVEWAGVIAATLTMIGTAGAGGVWIADQRYVTQESIKALEINRLDREITYIKIKKDQNEATNSEIIYLETLKQQKRALEQ